MLRMKSPAHFGLAVFLIFFSALLSPTSSQAQSTTATGGGHIIFKDPAGNSLAPSYSLKQPTTVLLGEPITLDVQVSAGPLTDVTWQVSGTIIKGYQATASSETVTPITLADLRQLNLRFYWIDQGPKQVNVIYHWTDNNGLRVGGVVTAYFNVVGPTNVEVTSQVMWAKARFFTDSGAAWVGFGDHGANPGIKFGVCQAPGSAATPWTYKCTKSVTLPSATSGTFQWLQIITPGGDVFQYIQPDGRACTTKSTGGPDAPFPKQTFMYGFGPGPVEDSVGQIVFSGITYKQLWRQFGAMMFLMWQAYGNDGYIPVPLGYVSWSAAYALESAPGPNKTVNWTIGPSEIVPDAFVPSSGWPPAWTALNGSADTPCLAQ